MRILIKGAGDLATGIAYRLRKSGYDVLMTEIEVPTTVRRTVAFSRAVYEQEAVVEGIKAVLVHSLYDILRVQSEGKVAVIVDKEANISEAYAPQVVVDAILAKKNLGTTMKEAGLVIGVGPGFNAGVDCHTVIETKRGHYLGRVIEAGYAIPNTGVPGDIGGYTTQRLIRSTGDGIWEPIVSIGDVVEEGDQVASVRTKDGDCVPVYAKMPGIVRGILQQGVFVTEGMKAGDIDIRCEKDHCFTISDKARAIGGGVLEAIVGYEHKIF